MELCNKIEDYLAFNSDEMKRDYPAVHDFLEEDTPEICADFEPGLETEFKARIKEQYGHVQEMLNVA